MLKYHNHLKFKNQKVLDLKFHKKKSSGYPIAPIIDPTSRHSAGGGWVRNINCYTTKRLLTVTDFQ